MMIDPDDGLYTRWETRGMSTAALRGHTHTHKPHTSRSSEKEKANQKP